MTTITIAPVQSVAPRGAERTYPCTRVCAAISSRIYLPAFSVPALALVLMGIGWSSGWGGAGFAGSWSSLRVVVIGPLALGVIGLILVVERIWPTQERALFARGHRHDLLIAVVHATLVLPLVTALTLSLVEVVRRLAPWIRAGADPAAPSPKQPRLPRRQCPVVGDTRLPLGRCVTSVTPRRATLRVVEESEMASEASPLGQPSEAESTWSIQIGPPRAARRSARSEQ
jgi:hypothetical protein